MGLTQKGDRNYCERWSPSVWPSKMGRFPSTYGTSRQGVIRMYEAASKAGVRTIGLLSGGWTAEELKQAGCIATYRDPADLLAQYDSSPLAMHKA